MNESPILPCPLCGFQALMGHGTIGDELVEYIQCANADCAVRITDYGSDQPATDLLRRWNKRVKL